MNDIENNIMPQDILAERMLLSGMLQDKGILFKALEKMKPEYFMVKNHRELFNLFKKEKDNNLIPIKKYLDGINTQEDFDCSLDALYSSGFSITCEKEIFLIIEAYKRRKAIEYCYNTINELNQNEDSNSEKILSGSISNFSNLIIENDSSMVKLGDLLSEEFDRIEKITKTGKQAGDILTGINGLDKKLCVRKSDYIVIGGRPSNCKSTLAGLIGRNVSRNFGPVLVFYLDTSKQKEVSRALFTEAGLNLYEFNLGKFYKDDVMKLTMVAGPLAELSLYLDDTPDITTSQIQAKCMRLKHEIGTLCLVIVDFMQNITAEVGRTEREKINSISKTLHTLPKIIGCPVLALSQISRYMNEHRAPPDLNNLKESGNIEQDADTVLLLHYPGHYPENYENGELKNYKLKNLLKVIVGKQKDGPVGYVDLNFHPQTMRITDRIDNYGEQEELEVWQNRI